MKPCRCFPAAGGTLPWRCIRHLVVEKQLAAPLFFPFAIDAGGDYFFVDCREPAAPVYYYRSDPAGPTEDGLVKVCDSLDGFWSELRNADEQPRAKFNFAESLVPKSNFGTRGSKKRGAFNEA